jgi:hypothetical protein
MDKKLEDKIFKKYPTLFPGGRNVDPKVSLLCFGLDVKNGWYKIIDKLCLDILKCVDGDKVVAVQVKEKYSMLRFYTDGASKEIYELISKAEEESGKICEECGKKGKMENLSGWYITTCKKCFKARKLAYDLKIKKSIKNNGK